MKPDFEWWKRPESYVDTSPPLTDDEKAAEFKRVLNASNEAEAKSIRVSIPSDRCYTVTLPPMPETPACFLVNSDGVIEVSQGGFAEL